MPNNYLYQVYQSIQKALRVMVVDASGVQITSFGASVTPPSAIGDGLKVVTTAGTAVTLASSTAIKSVIVTANSTNTGVIVVGGSTVVAASGATRRGYALSSGDSVRINIDDLVKVYIDATVNGEGVHYVYEA